MKNSKRMCIAFLLFSFVCPLVLADLSVGFYNSTCKNAETIIREVVTKRFDTDKSITAALLRMHFHDCFVHGCDASILINSTSQQQSEKDAGPNQTVRGFELIDAAKLALEAACPEKVSCADIITLATRDAVALSGGPNYTVPTGRRDGLVSNPADVKLPGPQLTVSQAFQFFERKNLTLDEMVTLLGAHTVGVAHCSFFQDRLSSFQGNNGPDPTMNRTLVDKLTKICGSANSANPDPIAFLDQSTPFIVDNQYYNQILAGNGVLQIDQELALNGASTRGIVSGFASNGNGFKQSFANAMVRLGSVEVLVGNAGEIRKKCWEFNSKATTNPPPVNNNQPGNQNEQEGSDNRDGREAKMFPRKGGRDFFGIFTP